MKIKVELLGLPALAKLLGKKSEIDLPGETVADLIAFLAQRCGRQGQNIFLDKDGKLDPAIQVLLNEKGVINRDRFSNQRLKDGDKVVFMILMEGG